MLGIGASAGGYLDAMDLRILRRLGASLREIALPLVVFLLCLQAFEIVLMPLVG